MALTLKCEWCGNEFKCYPARFKKDKHHCCSKECANNLYKQIRESNPKYLNCTCDICGKKFHIKPSHKERFKHISCSRECDIEYRKQIMTGEGNHQYGLKKELNPTWNGGRRILNGYCLVYIPEHPFSGSDGCVPEHRLVAEKFLLNDDNSIEINGNKYLKPEYVVHHIDENRLNNDVANLMVLTKGEHIAIHNKRKPRQRNEKGQFIKTL